jgi:hypothetical protein
MPSGTSIWFTTVLPSAPKRMSHDDANSEPPPPTRPLTSAIVAFGMVRTVSHMTWKALGSVSRCGSPSVGNMRMADTSKWAMKKSGSALRKTTTRTSSSTASSPQTCASSR